ncbi:MAG: chemotaxis protein MotB [Oceanospirillaceae bacterium]|nr:chemotaxis protein MotB [Oceanospirillaceae bacterium]MBT14358.1 chemotaxis protein MotB [Oceanospirillaceae bacterium]
MKVFRRTAASVDEENPYWMSFSDIMAGLLILFVLACAVLVLNLTQKQQDFDKSIQELKQADTVRRTILHEIKEKLEKKGITVIVNENDSIVSISSDLLGFASRDYSIREQYQNTALDIGQVLGDVIRKEGRSEYLDTVFIEGHTDVLPTSFFGNKGNWGLSAYRAISLWQFWNEKLKSNQRLDILKNHAGHFLFSVSGYGKTRPVTETQQTEDERKENRRIDIRFTIRHPDLKDFEKVKEKSGFGVEGS